MTAWAWATPLLVALALMWCHYQLDDGLGWRRDIAAKRGAGSVEGLAPRRTILVLDLDETLVHSPNPSTDGSVGRGMLLRPHVIQFLAAVRDSFDELVVFTAGVREYASPILDLLERSVGGTVFSRRFYRDSCSVDPRTGLLVKDLRVVSASPEDVVLLLDNTPSAYALQPHLGVPIASFIGDPNDRALIDAIPVLKRRVRRLVSSSV